MMMAPGDELLPLCTEEQLNEHATDFFMGVPASEIGCREGLQSNGELILDGILGDWVKDTRNGLAQVIKDVSTFWIDAPTPDVGDGNGGMSEPVSFIQSSLGWYTAAFLIMAIIIGAIRAIWYSRGDDIRKIGRLILTFIAVSTMGVSVLALCITAAAGFARWIIDRSVENSSLGENLMNFFHNDAIFASSVLALFLMILAAGVAGIQYVIMLFRGASLFILAGTMPIAASFYITETGENLLKTHISWCLGFVFYLPAAAIVYATGFRLLGVDMTTDSGSKMALHGIAVMLMAIFTLPAIMRLVSPIVGNYTQGRGSGMAVLGGATVIAATGARSMARV